MMVATMSRLSTLQPASQQAAAVVE